MTKEIMTDLSRMFVLIVALFVLAVVGGKQDGPGEFLQITGNVTVNGTSADDDEVKLW